MGPYGSVIPAADRWAIIAYVRALQDAAKKAAVPAKDNATATATPKVPVEVPATTE